MSQTETILTQAYREAAPAFGEMALALAARRYRPGAPAKWARLLRAAAALVERLG